MQALSVHDFAAPIALVDLPEPQPGPGQLRVRVQAVGISYFDLLIARGGYQMRPALPFVVGSEWAGVVDALGPGTDGHWAVGQRVCGSASIGAWAQQLCVPATGVNAVADQVAIEEAAVLATPYGTVLYGLRERGQLQAGETVLVLGATGSIGQAAVQVAKALGARVIAAATGLAKQAVLRHCGADEVVDLADAGWKDQVKALAGPKGVDVVADPVGGPAMDAAFRTLGWGGRLLVLGFASGEIGTLKANLGIVKGASLVGVDMRQFRERQPDDAARVLADVMAMHAAGRIRPVIAHRLPVAQFAQAMALAGDRATTGRVVMLL